MKKMKMFCIAAAVLLLVPMSLRAAEKKFDTEKMLSDLEKQLRLSQEEYEKLRPELEKALKAKSREMKETVERSVNEGVLELEGAMKELEKASEEAKAKLDEALNSEQVKELRAYLGRLDKEALEEVRRELLAEMESLLNLTEQQILELEPVLKEQLDKTGKLVEKFAKDSGRALEDFGREYAALASESRERLGEALDPAQLEKLDKRLKEMKKKILKKLFPDG